MLSGFFSNKPKWSIFLSLMNWNGQRGKEREREKISRVTKEEKDTSFRKKKQEEKYKSVGKVVNSCPKCSLSFNYTQKTNQIEWYPLSSNCAWNIQIKTQISERQKCWANCHIVMCWRRKKSDLELFRLRCKFDQWKE